MYFFVIGIIIFSIANSTCFAQILPFKHKDYGMTVTPDARQLADQGNAFAQAIVSMHYQIGWDTEKNPELAVKYAVASAKAHNALGIFRLGSLMREGVGIPKDEQKGLSLQATAFQELYSAKDPYSITAAAILIFQGKVVGQNIPKQQRYRDAIELYKKAANMGFAPAQFNYAMALNDGDGVERNANLSKQYLDEAVAQSYPLAQKFALEQERKLQGIAQASADSVIEGLNMAGNRWAYEFLDHTPHPAQDLSTDSAGVIVFSNEQYVVRKAKLQGSVDVGASTSKTELSFYDARSSKLSALISVPNNVFDVGIVPIPNKDIFYIATITPGKYQFVDYPMALVLVDIKNRKIERLPIVKDDYWLALNNPISITASKSTITVKVNSGATSTMGGKYLSSSPVTSAFKDINVVLSEGYFGDEQPDFNESFLAKHESAVQSNTSGLSYLGSTAGAAIVPLLSRGEFVVSGKNSNFSDLKLLRAEENGKLTVFNFSNLYVHQYSTSDDGAFFPRFFSDGTIGCMSAGNFHFIRNGGLQSIKLPITDAKFDRVAGPADLFKRKEYFKKLYNEDSDNDELNAPAITFSDNAIGVRVRNDEFFAANSPFDYGFQPISLSKGVEDYLRKAKDSALQTATDGSNYKNNLLSSSIYNLIADWDIESKTVVVQNEIEFQRINIENGRVIGEPLLTHGGGYPGVNYSNTSEGWRAYTENYSHSGGSSSDIKLESLDGERKEIWAVQQLSQNANPLALKVNHGKALLLYGAGDTIALAAVELVPRQNWDQAKVNPIKIWKFASRFGNALCEHQSGALFVPNASGFEVWSIWGEDPIKRFDLVLGTGAQYAVVLPSGSYAGSPGCESLIRLNAGDGGMDGSTLAAWRNRPADIIKAIGGDPAQTEVLSKVTERWLKKLGNPERNPEPTAQDIPALALANNVPLWAEGEAIKLQFNNKPGTASVKEVVVRVNGVDQQQGSNLVVEKSTVERMVKLAEGQNWIEAVAIDEKGRSSNLVRFRTILREASMPTKRFIIAMGVSNYRDSSLNLEFAAKDATDLASTIKNSTQGESEVLLLTNEQANKDAITKIRAFLAKATENDEVMAFCAGHGVLDSNLDYFYASYEFDSANPSETGIKLDELVAAIGSSKSLKRLLLLDTCHSGQVGEKDKMLLAQMNTELLKGVRAVKQRGMSVKPVAGLSAEGQQRFIEEMFLLPGLHRGINIIGASGGAEFALESAQWNNGVFTATIIEALRDKKADLNGDTRISVSELRDFLAQRVSELTKGAQKPSVVASERDQDFDLIRAAYKRP